MRSCVPPARQRRRRLDTEPLGKASAGVEEEGPPVLPHQVERPPGQQHDLRRPVMGQRPGDFRLAPAVDEQQVAGERHALQGVDPGSGGGDQRAVRRADVPLDDDRRIEQAVAFPRCRRNTGHGTGFLQLSPGAGAGFVLQPRKLAGALHLQKPGLDLRQQVRLGDRPCGAADAQVLRRCRPGHAKDGRQRKRSQGPEQYRQAHGAASTTGHGRMVADPSPGSNSSGRTSGPCNPSHGMSGSATARPRIRSRGARPTSA